MSERRGRSNGMLEREVVACLAAAGRPMTAADVRVDLGDDLAYTTVLTILTRLFEKGALTRAPRGRAYEYELAGGQSGFEANLTAHQMSKLLLDSGADRASVLSRFVDGLSPQDEAVLRDLLGAHEEPPGTAPAGRRPKKR